MDYKLKDAIECIEALGNELDYDRKSRHIITKLEFYWNENFTEIKDVKINSFAIMKQKDTENASQST